MRRFTSTGATEARAERAAIPARRSIARQALGGPLNARALTELQRRAGNRAARELVSRSAATRPVVQRCRDGQGAHQGQVVSSFDPRHRPEQAGSGGAAGG